MKDSFQKARNARLSDLSVLPCAGAHHSQRIFQVSNQIIRVLNAD
jgi:hypothetical protein